jgi:type IV pilus assembly protein PilN
MANINLLPWRAERRKLREREFYMMLVAAAAAALAAFLAAMLWMSHLISSQEADNAYLEQEIKALDKKIEEIQELDKRRSQLLTRKEIIEQLQSNRSQMVHLFDEMVKTIPDGTRLNTMKQAGETLTLEGVAESNSRVASYMRNIDGSPWMGRTDLRKIENKSAAKDVDKKMPYAFSLDVKLRKPQSDKDAADAGANPQEASSKDQATTDVKKPGLGAQLDDAATKLTTKPVATDKPVVAAESTPTAPATPTKTPATGEKK